MQTVQTIAGAIATGTHGSTLTDGSLSSQVISMHSDVLCGPRGCWAVCMNLTELIIDTKSMFNAQSLNRVLAYIHQSI